MSTSGPSRSGAASREPGAGGGRQALLWALLGVGVALVAVSAVVLLRSGAPATGTAETVQGSASPQPAAPEPITVDVALDGVHSMANDALFGDKASVARDAARSAVGAVGDVLGTYLNAQFVDAGTRLTEAPLDDLLSGPARRGLTPGSRAGLGASDVALATIDAAPVSADARVLTRGDAARVVVVTYELRARAALDGGAEGPLTQQATMVFVPADDHWRVQAADAALTLPGPAEAAS